MLSLLGVHCQKPKLGTVLNLDFSVFPFVDLTGRHSVGGIGVTSVGGRASFDPPSLFSTIPVVTYSRDFNLATKFDISVLVNIKSGAYTSDRVIFTIAQSPSDMDSSIEMYYHKDGYFNVSFRAPNAALITTSPGQLNYAPPLDTDLLIRLWQPTATSVALSVNGAFIGSIPIVPRKIKDRNLYIGGYYVGQQIGFIGTMDNFKWVNYTKTAIDFQFATDSSDATGRYTTTNVGGVTFSGGKAVWSTESPPRYLVTNEDVDWDHSKTLVVSARINSTANGVSKPLWAISNAAANSYIRATHLLSGGGIIVQVNGTNLLSTSTYPDGVDYTLVVKYYSNGLTEIYVDGVLDGSGTLPTLAAASRKLYIGYSPTFVTFSHNGTIDYLTVEEV